MSLALQPKAVDELRGYLAEVRATSTLTAEVVADLRERERQHWIAYSRKYIRVVWIIAAILTAAFAWVARQPPFEVPPIFIQGLALVVNAMCWRLGVWIYFKRGDRR
jgi:hypothetical protein